MNAIKTTKRIVTQEDLEKVLFLKQSRNSIRKRLEEIDNNLDQFETEIIQKIQSGAEVNSTFEVFIRTQERRYPSWKNHYVEAVGAEAAERVLNMTKPIVTKSLVIKE